MAYIKQEWKDEILNGPEQYNITAPGTNINGAEITLSTPITQAGTPVTAERMNHIEEGIAGITPASIGAMPERPIIIEMGGASWTGGIIDFHHGNTTEDFTTRMEEFVPGQINVKSKNPGACVFSVDGFVSSKNINDSGWIDMLLANGWVRTAGGVAKFRKYNNVVYVTGEIHGSSATSPAFVGLPPGFRPHVRMQFSALRDDFVPVGGSVTTEGALWFAATDYGNKINFSGSWLAEI